MSHRQDTCAGDSTSMYHSQICTKTQVFVSVFAARMVLAAQELFAMKNGDRWHGQQEDCDHAGFAAVDDEAVAAEASLGGRDGVAQRLGDHVVRRLVCVLFYLVLVPHRPNCA